MSTTDEKFAHAAMAEATHAIAELSSICGDEFDRLSIREKSLVLMGYRAKREASTEPSTPPGAQHCHSCEGKGYINKCVVCGSDEPRTGTCGSNDPRALCNFVAAGALTDDAKAVIDTARKLVQCKGRYHTEQNFKALAKAVEAYTREKK